ncbi:immunity 26/phosphotriesterase HocA family protein [Vibrio fluvialis]|nr:immunity 26/phosphotriesterase HocA family protein [Vibrio fluvialis]MBY7940905.1 immunity 26/phosphotriesterase HocA family protein [Vibrio fluvialis]MBY8167578.1 immunity 26/phosphotriesterase HocA family protein [Vibrio fluvialis]MBY8257906.1 immunity 26/phosphotriesterase HocA family protein [Vibrio fluvialis]MBY8266308.1 immunity 26/phosphotriesterase HocA family protein [Vibrio fluvialis]
MSNKKLVVNSGGVYFIPLFLYEETSAKNFSRYKFGGVGQEFCFFRIIFDHLGSGILIEIFNCVGGIEADMNEIVSFPRLFKPIYISG